jgi:tetratricopeptide (TPR) repeat protein
VSGGGRLSRRSRARRALANLLAALAAVAMLSPARAESGEGAACLAANDNPDQTIARCTRAIEASEFAADKLPVAFNRRGLAWFAKGEAERAGSDFDAALRLNPNYAWAHNNRGIIRAQQGDLDRAIAAYDDAIRLKPGYAFALTNRGNAWLAKGDADRAIADFDAAVALAPPQVELALAGRGRGRMAKGDFDGALVDFDAALKANPNYANALSGRAYLRFCQGRFDAAAADFALERRLRPDAESAIELFLAQARGGHDAKAALAEVAQSADPQQGRTPAAALFLGEITPEQALQAAADKDPRVQRRRSCAANFQVGEWYVLNKGPEQARAYLTRARQLCDKSLPEFAAAGAELERLK